MDTVKLDDSTRQISMSIEELEAIMGKAGVIGSDEAISEARTLPGELKITIVR